MSKSACFKFYTANFLDGTRSMTAAEVGDYIRLLALIYDKGGKIENDVHVLRHLFGCSRVRDVRPKVQRLVDLGKLSIDAEGFIHNGRADREMKKLEASSEASSEASTEASRAPKKSTNSSRARPHKKMKVKTSPNGDVKRAHARASSQPDFSAYLQNELSKLQHRKNGHAEPYPTVAGYLDAGDRRGEDPGADPAGQTAGPNAH
jgi:uncharacterized protein YdaU (DUF1376 family)